MAKKRSKIFKTRYFGLLIGACIAIGFLLLDLTSGMFDSLNTKMLDFHFLLKNVMTSVSVNEGVRSLAKKPNISSDIVIVGIDSRSIDKFGKWPFKRSVHADLLDSFSRIKEQDQRELAVLFDVLILEPDADATEDARLLSSVSANGKVFLENILSYSIADFDLHERNVERQAVLLSRFGQPATVQGPWQEALAFESIYAPLEPLSQVAVGYGHANYLQDFDQVYRRQMVISKFSVETDRLRLDELAVDYRLDADSYQRLAWIDINGVSHTIQLPLNEASLGKLKMQMASEAPTIQVDTNNDGTIDDEYLFVRVFTDYFIPSVTLSIALEYYGVDFNKVIVTYGKEVLIPNPTIKTQDGSRKPLGRDVSIPIDDQGQMLINFMGWRSSANPEEYQTYPVYSYAAYAERVPGEDTSTWPRTKALQNKIVMVGAFAEGIAQDEKPTPFGLMYGIEIHANALNTILMDKFLRPIPKAIDLLMLALAVMIIALLCSRFSTIWSLVILLFALVLHFVNTTIFFENFNLILDFPKPALGMALAFLTIVSYRAMTEEKDKKQIQANFGKYVSPKVVDLMIESGETPELGGVDKEITVLFSDIRGFTSLSETLTPQELVNHLNVYLTAMTDLILEYGGTLDKYVGDEIMCFWGAPLSQAEHAILACKCAIRQMQVLDELNKGWPESRRIRIGIGINSGIMTVGNMGSPGRMNYTLMGDNVNLGARLEGTNKQYGTGIIISEYTYGLVKDYVTVRELDNIRVKGKNKPVLIFELIDCNDLTPPVLADKKET